MLTAVRSFLLPLVAGVAVAFGGRAHAQQPAMAASPTPTGPVINDVAPDFSLAGATRYGLLKNPVRLSDYRGRTVVLAFFYQARTKG
jgi:cytochrome oxidase Cu insertion factor (SCO1/SenC/PrrC family)